MKTYSTSCFSSDCDHAPAFRRTHFLLQWSYTDAAALSGRLLAKYTSITISNTNINTKKKKKKQGQRN